MQLTEVNKDKGLPMLTKTSWNLILELAADVCNKLPMGKYNNDFYLCPADLIGNRNDIIVEETSSKLEELNCIMRGLLCSTG